MTFIHNNHQKAEWQPIGLPSRLVFMSPPGPEGGPTEAQTTETKAETVVKTPDQQKMELSLTIDNRTKGAQERMVGLAKGMELQNDPSIMEKANDILKNRDTLKSKIDNLGTPEKAAGEAVRSDVERGMQEFLGKEAPSAEPVQDAEAKPDETKTDATKNGTTVTIGEATTSVNNYANQSILTGGKKTGEGTTTQEAKTEPAKTEGDEKKSEKPTEAEAKAKADFIEKNMDKLAQHMGIGKEYLNNPVLREGLKKTLGGLDQKTLEAIQKGEAQLTKEQKEGIRKDMVSQLDPYAGGRVEKGETNLVAKMKLPDEFKGLSLKGDSALAQRIALKYKVEEINGKILVNGQEPDAATWGTMLEAQKDKDGKMDSKATEELAGNQLKAREEMIKLAQRMSENPDKKINLMETIGSLIQCLQVLKEAAACFDIDTMLEFAKDLPRSGEEMKKSVDAYKKEMVEGKGKTASVNDLLMAYMDPRKSTEAKNLFGGDKPEQNRYRSAIRPLIREQLEQGLGVGKIGKIDQDGSRMRIFTQKNGKDVAILLSKEGDNWALETSGFTSTDVKNDKGKVTGKEYAAGPTNPGSRVELGKAFTIADLNGKLNTSLVGAPKPVEGEKKEEVLRGEKIKDGIAEGGKEAVGPDGTINDKLGMRTTVGILDINQVKEATIKIGTARNGLEKDQEVKIVPGKEGSNDVFVIDGKGTQLNIATGDQITSVTKKPTETKPEEKKAEPPKAAEAAPAPAKAEPAKPAEKIYDGAKVNGAEAQKAIKAMPEGEKLWKTFTTEYLQAQKDGKLGNPMEWQGKWLKDKNVKKMS